MKRPACLPQEVIVEILLKLPVISLVRCTCICKSWYSLIKNAVFFSTHLKQGLSSANDSLFLLRNFYNHEEHLSLHFDNDKFTEYMNLDKPSKLKQYYSIIGSCNGLICFADSFWGCGNAFTLWNPCIRKTLTLPKPNITFKTHGGYQAFVGFGYDLHTDDYKVLRIAASTENDQSTIEVYSLLSGSWKCLPTLVLKYEILDSFSEAFVKGVFHFIASPKNAQDRMLVLGFDVGDEVLRDNLLPETFNEEIRSVLVYKESNIAVFTLDSNYLCHLWLMKKYGDLGSWIKVFIVETQEGLIPRALRFRKSGELLLSFSEGEIVLYDLEKQQTKSLGIHKKLGDCIFLHPYVESLMLLDKAHH
ncbi:hypothetical protein P3X46_024411 [Hevea brasiliensis]|uniref:Uncharacterized protein n=2 Tax=Hevea brasiliensis TaxID=3981 RepID=A0A6A6N1Y7_HEVBR|nr:F-box/kelch-repeat protein At3g06240-like [Hevea brasiliensis]KAF2319690.1 hypothetical protein GH714_018026 [Hevea brasiliensis]KAJ9158867.1 hypothetical protein P3X46_024411 [Hevea brasiliensis]